MSSRTPAIETTALSKTFGGEVRALQEVDLRVEQGEVFGFLGPNGAGKSTLIRILLDLMRPTAGRAALLGEDSRSPGGAARRAVGYLPGDLRLWPRATGRAQLASLSALRGGGHEREIAALAERLGGQLDRPVRDLSKGNRQKIGLIQAFMHRPTPGHPGRADQRARPARPGGVPRRWCARRRPTAAPCSCRRTRWTRCSTWPPASASSAPAGWSPSSRSRRCSPAASGTCA